MHHLRNGSTGQVCAGQRVKANLIKGGVGSGNIEVSEKGNVSVTGIIHQVDDKQIIEDITKTTKGVVLARGCDYGASRVCFRNPPLN